MSYILFAWVASFVFALEVLIGKLTTKYAVKNPWLFNVIWSFYMLVFTLPFALANNVGMPTAWFNLTLAGFFSAMFGVFYIITMTKIDVSILSPLFNFRTAFAAILSVFFLQEILSPYQYVLIGVMFIAGMFSSTDEKVGVKNFFQWPILLCVGSMVILALMSIFVNKALAENGFWEVTLWMAVLTLLFQLPTIPFFLKDLKTFHIRQTTGIAGMAIAGVLGTLAVNVAYEQNVSVTSAILSIPFSMIIAFLLSFFYPKLLEKHTLRVYVIRFVSAGVMIFAALGLSK